MNNDKLILSLCDYSGVWSQPYADAGYHVVRVDLGHPAGMDKGSNNVWTLGADITKLQWDAPPHAVLAAPSCTCFCRPSSQWWFRQDFMGETARDVRLFKACLRLCKLATAWWALENPPGRHTELIPELGPPAWQFQPWEYGDPWSKQTYIWGTARKPEPCNVVTPEPTRRTPNGKTQGRIAFMSSTAKRDREKTPEGFARAFFEANQ